MSSLSQVPFGAIAAVMLITGAANSLLLKYMTTLSSPTGVGESAKKFEHPVVQTGLMMLGELMCLVARWFQLQSQRKQTLYTSSNRERELLAGLSPRQAILFTVPVLCDCIATTLVMCSLLAIPVSVVQMTRGSVVIFSVLLSLVLLGKRQTKREVLGVAFVCLGISLVGLSALRAQPAQATFDKRQGSPTAQSLLLAPTVGLMLAVLSQLFQALMLVVEEKILKQALASRTGAPPPALLCVGLEGLFGCGIIALALPTLAAMNAESPISAIYQLSHNPTLAITAFVAICSIAAFNVSGIQVTMTSSSVARATIDSSRTMLVWAVELMLGWNTFSWLQLFGFGWLLVGTLWYNNLMVPNSLKDRAENEDFDASLAVANCCQSVKASVKHKAAAGAGGDVSMQGTALKRPLGSGIDAENVGLLQGTGSDVEEYV